MKGRTDPSTVVNIELREVRKNGQPNGAAKDQPTSSVLSAHDINYFVNVPTKCCRSSVQKQILFNVTGLFKKGMTAIMGPTGSGKSSFLDVLAGRKEPSGLSGQLLLDGKPVPENFKCMVGYVVQDDVVMGTLSVKENFHFSASLRLPSTVGATERSERVETVIKELGLVKCADTKVGTEFIRGVSGGERKRCNIGMELIISPPVLFLDEPTTGLDANTANTVLMFLKRLSRRGRTIIFSIHQPRYSIYRLFDSLMLLSGGHIVYHGPSSQALDFFGTQGFHCQEHNNPPDFFLDVINGDPSTLKDGAIQEQDVDEEFEAPVSQESKLVEGFKSSQWFQSLQAEAGAIFSEFEAQGGLRGEKHEKVDYATSIFRQVVVVAGRALKNIIRNPQTSILTIGTSLVFAIIIGAIYWQLSEDPVTGFTDRGGVIFFLIMNQMFFNMSAVEVFINERKIFMHENISGFYRVSVYFMVKIFFDIIPLRLVPVIIMSCVVYFSVGLNPGADHFFKFMFGLFCTTLSAAGLCFLISSTVKIFAVAQMLLALSYVLMMLFGGFLISLDSIGPWLNWAQYFSLFKYALALLYINELKDRDFSNNDTMSRLCCLSTFSSIYLSLFLLLFSCRRLHEQCGQTNSFSVARCNVCSAIANTMLEQMNIDYETPWDLWKNYMALLIYAFCLFMLTYVQLRRMKKTT